jgi:hypothetical protein
MSIVLNTRYKVTITTGDMARAGTDAEITVGLSQNGESIRNSALRHVLSAADYDQSHQTGPYLLTGSFEQGDIDYMFLDDHNSGEVTGIRLAQDGTGEGPGWFVEQVLVHDLLTGKVWSARPMVWLAKDEAPFKTSIDVQLSPYRPSTNELIEYQIIVTTGDASGAGTDGEVRITLTGANGIVSTPYLLDMPDANDFECNTVRHQNTGQVWVFPIEFWLGKGDGPLYVEKLPG